MAIYTKATLIYLVHDFNRKAKTIGDYEIEVSTYGKGYIVNMITEDGLKQKYMGSALECCNRIMEYLDA